MLGYYMRLALKSFRRNPGLTALMVVAIALGIAVCVMTITIYHAMSGNPIWWKNDRLYAVTMDSWDPNEPHDKKRPDLPPPQLTYRDAMRLYASDIPEHKVVMYRAIGVIAGGTSGGRPERISMRVTTADFFPMFDVPFLYGGGWRRDADDPPEPVIVLSREQNEKLFGGENSVGRTVRLNDREFRVVGVLDEWAPQPRFYDLNTGSFDEPEDVYIPWGWGPSLQQLSAGNTNCWKPEDLDTFEDFLASECVWLQMWVELPTAEARERMQAFIDAYWAEQRALGRFQRPKNNRLSNVAQWLEAQEVVQDDNRVLLGLAFAFLAVCLINTVGLLLAKFLSSAAISGVRRALGASRREIFAQHLVEVGVIATAGALFGLALSWLGLYGVRALYDTGIPGERGGIQALAHFDAASVVAALVLAVVSALAAGFYPAWRIGRVPPASYLRSQ